MAEIGKEVETFYVCGGGWWGAWRVEARSVGKEIHQKRVKKVR